MRNWLKFLLLMAGLIGLSWWTGGIPLAGGATFHVTARGVACGTMGNSITRGYHGKTVKIMLSLSPVKANSNKQTVLCLRYTNRTARRLNLESSIFGFVDPKDATHPTHTDMYDPFPTIVASSLKEHSSDWMSELAPKASATHKFTIKAIGHRLYCIQVIVDFVRTSWNDLRPIAGGADTCTKIE